MSLPAQPELVRHHQRQACSVDASLRVSSEHAERVVISASVCDSHGRVPVKIVDVSDGGMGLHCGLFIPARTIFEVDVEDPCAPGAVQRLTVQLRVQRITMMSREPRYYLGAAYTGAGDLAGLRQRLRAQAAPTGEDRHA